MLKTSRGIRNTEMKICIRRLVHIEGWGLCRFSMAEVWKKERYESADFMRIPKGVVGQC